MLMTAKCPKIPTELTADCPIPDCSAILSKECLFWSFTALCKYFSLCKSKHCMITCAKLAIKEILISVCIPTQSYRLFVQLGSARQSLVGSSGGYTSHGYTSHASPRACGARLGQIVQELVEIFQYSNLPIFYRSVWKQEKWQKPLNPPTFSPSNLLSILPTFQPSSLLTFQPSNRTTFSKSV